MSENRRWVEISIKRVNALIEDMISLGYIPEWERTVKQDRMIFIDKTTRLPNSNHLILVDKTEKGGVEKVLYGFLQK